jgi:DNA polymerase III alpha subunit
MINFCSPHCHPASLDSASNPEAFCKKELELGTGTVTVTDHGTLAAVRQVYDLCHGKKYKGKLTPILGLEAYFRDDADPILTGAGIERHVCYEHQLDHNRIEPVKFEKLHTEKPAEAALYSRVSLFDKYNKYYHLTMHFQDEAAFKVASRIISNRDLTAEKHGSERKPLFTWTDLEELGAQNVTFGSGCLAGMVQRHIFANNRPDLAEAYYKKVRSLVKPGNFFVEVFPHVLNKNWTSNVVIKFEDGSEEKFAKWKNLKTDKSPKSGEGWKAEYLADDFKKHKGVHGCLRAVMENREWVEKSPKRIVSIESREGFVHNECSPDCPGGDVQFRTNRFVMDMAEKYGDRILISDDSHFTAPDDKVVQDIKLGQSGSWRMSNSYHRFSSDEAWPYFRDVQNIPQATFEKWIDNSREWADKFKGFKFAERKSLPTKFYPQDTLRHTMKLIKQTGRWKETPEYNARLKAEIDLLHYNGTIDLLPYFFVDNEIGTLYEDNNKITGPSRGSAGGVLLSYLLGITHIDPLKYNLSLDRFITLDRIATKKLPDIDFDLPDRDLLCDPETGWLKKRFGDCYAQISTDTTLKLRSAVKDVARWYRAVDGKSGYVPPDIEALTKKFLDAPQGITDKEFIFGYQKDDVFVPGNLENDLALQEYIRLYPKEWENVQKCVGLCRQKSAHACGFIISDDPISSFIPLTTVTKNRVTQFTAASVEAAGGLKMDFLVVSCLKDIQLAINLIQGRHAGSVTQSKSIQINGNRVPTIRAVPFKNSYVDIWDLPEDQSVFRDICESKTETVFQFSTPSAKKWLKSFDTVRYTDDEGQVHKGLDSIQALATFTALDRPGPLDYFVKDSSGKPVHNMLIEYSHRAKGMERHGSFPILDRLFPETFGVICFQESLQEAYQKIGHTTGIEANNFRVHIGKKQMKEVHADKVLFMKGAVDEIGLESAEQLWQSMETFGQYGFCKAHAIGYVVISYACAFLKHHYPLEWWTAVLTNADKKEVEEEFWPYCGHLIKTPDINKSTSGFLIDGDGIRAPLSLIQGIGPKAQDELSEGKPYTDIADYCQKIKKAKAAKGRSALNRGITYKLICSGVMDSLFPPDTESPEQLALYEEAWAVVDKKKKAKSPDAKYTSLNPPQRYQLKKGILNMYGEDLRPLFVETGVPGMIKAPKGYDFSYQNRKKEFETVGVLSMKNSNRAQQVSPLPDGGIKWGLAAYVISEEKFTYQGSKKACKMVLDVQGMRQEFVKWPNRDGTLPAPFNKTSLTGALVLAIVSVWKEGNPASVDDLVIIQPPLVLGENNDE